jgi:subtilisin family serine protease
LTLGLRSLLIAATLWFAAMTPAAAEDRAPAQAAAPAGQILVMLRLPPEHFRAGASYGGGYGDGAGLAARRRTAERLARQHGLTLVTGWPMPVVGVDCYVMALPARASAEAAAADLSRDPEVAWSEPMHLYRAQGAAASPNDPLFRLQPAASAWRLADLHETATGRGVRVAVVDSRVDAGHPDLAGQVEVARDFLPARPGEAEAHGTAVAGIIAALADNNLGIAGVAPRARLMALRACWRNPAAQDTLCDTLSLARALNFAIENSAQVINLSLAGPPDQLLGKLLDIAMARGAVVVGAVDAGLDHGGFPASHLGVVAVATDEGAAVSKGVYLAPGHDVPTTQPRGRWSLVTGSSYAAAHVSGLLALVRETDSRPGEASRLLVRREGGEIDACATVLRARAPCAACRCAQPPATSR